MLIISQRKDKVTESMEFEIRKKETCKSIFIDEASYRKYKKIASKKDDGHMSIEELKRSRRIDKQDFS